MGVLAAWIRATSLSQGLGAQAGWLWPLCESLHFVGLALLLGCAGFFDLRLMGFMKRVPLSAARELIPWAMLGFAINLVTGLVFFISEPQQYVVKGIWWAKVLFLLVAAANALVFERLVAARGRTLGDADDLPLSFKVVGAVSLASWLAVLYCGRMLPYVQPGLNSNL